MPSYSAGGDRLGSARSRSAARERFLADLAPGVHVVHIEHGIGKYAGMRRIEQDGVPRDYLEIEYASGDRLYVPTDQSDRVNRYIGPSDRSPTTHRLGASDWVRAKSRVRSAVRLIAKELLDLYAARQVLPGRAFRSRYRLDGRAGRQLPLPGDSGPDAGDSWRHPRHGTTASHGPG